MAIRKKITAYIMKIRYMRNANYRSLINHIANQYTAKERILDIMAEDYSVKPDQADKDGNGLFLDLAMSSYPIHNLLPSINDSQRKCLENYVSEIGGIYEKVGREKGVKVYLERTSGLRKRTVHQLLNLEDVTMDYDGKSYGMKKK